MSKSFPPIIHFAEALVKEGILTKNQLAVARVSQKNLGEDLGAILIKKGFLDEKGLMEFLARHLKVPFASLEEVHPEPELLRELSSSFAKRNQIFPIRSKEGVIEIAMANPLDNYLLEDLKGIFRREIRPFLASPQQIEEAIEKAYAQTQEDVTKSIGIVETISDDDTYQNLESKQIEEIASGPKVIAAVNNLITKAWKEEASDIHIEPLEKTSRIRYRVDGVLHERGEMQRNMHFAVVSRLKIMGGLDIAEHRIPQDGRVRVRLVRQTLDMRMSTCPTQYGEKIVLRLLSKEGLRKIEDLGFSKKDRRLYTEMITKSHGIFLVTGPTGSGKSTTLYAALQRINSPELNIISIEDPVESEITGISQVELNPKAGLTFASILRSVLRQDPDVIMIGEIRDSETANIAVRAAITGHLVLSTLHTNTAAGAISRLVDLGLEPFLISSALQGVCAQRLVRKICPRCREESPVEKLGKFKSVIKKSYRGKGCPRCKLTGYAGRIGIFEMAPLNDQLRELIYKETSEKSLVEELRKQGFAAMQKDGFEKVEQGITTLEEVLRVTEEV